MESKKFFFTEGGEGVGQSRLGKGKKKGRGSKQDQYVCRGIMGSTSFSVPRRFMKGRVKGHEQTEKCEELRSRV